MKNIEFAIKQVPQLTDHGIGVCEPWEIPPKERKEHFLHLQQQLLMDVEEFEKVCCWLKQIKPIKTMNRFAHAYRMKDIAEECLSCYISKGIFIAAAICCGFKFKQSGDSPNAIFNMSSISIKRARCRNN